MDKILEIVAKVNSAINGVVWGWPMIVLILGVGIFLTVRTKFLQVRKFSTSWTETIVPTVKDMGKHPVSLNNKENTVSPFEAFATAISGTVGTGNIIGVTSAIMSGGPGAVFWMWISAFFGMVTNYAENVLGMFFRKKDEATGEFSGGPMQYLSNGIGKDVKGGWGEFLRGFGKVLGVMAAVFCVFAAIGMSGAQTNNIAGTFEDIFGKMEGVNTDVVVLIAGIVIAILVGLVILGGIKSIGRVASILVPFMSLLFILMALIIIIVNANMIGNAFALIFGNIFSFDSAVAGFGGYVFAQVIQKGLARGIFSNEAGLGSSVIAHSASETREPVKQGLWGIFEVFFDTFIICTLTALVILVSFGDADGQANVLYAENALSTTVVSMRAFEGVFGTVGTVIYAVIIPLFAITTILAWSYYGEKCVQFLFEKTGSKGQKIASIVFKVLYVLLIVVAAVMDNTLAWEISDTFNGLMALPNLVGLIFMGGLVAQITQNYFDRKAGKDVTPMLSAYPEQNAQFIIDLQKEIAAENGETVESTETAEESAEA